MEGYRLFTLLRFLRTLSLPVWLACANLGLASVATLADQPIAEYATAYRALGMAQLSLPYVDNIRAIVRETNVPQQRRMFSEFKQRLRKLEANGVNACLQLDWSRMAFEVDTNL